MDDLSNFSEPLELVFRRGTSRGLIDRPVRDRLPGAQGLPEGNAKAVIDAFGELVDEGCLAVHRAEHQRQRSDGAAGDRATVPGARDQRLRFRALAGGVDVPAQQRLDDRRADPVGAPDGQGRAEDGGCARGALVHRAGVPQELPPRRAIRGHTDRGRGAIAQTGQDISAAVAALHEAGASAIVHCGFGLGVAEINAALAALDWDPPRYMGTALETGFNERLWDTYRGWIGLEQYDEGNQVGQEFLDRYEAAYGHRPEYFGPLLWRDCAMAFLHAFADAAPLSPWGSRRHSSGSRCCRRRAARRARASRSARGSTGAGWARATSWRGRSTPTARSAGEYWKSSLVGRYGQD